MCGGNRRAVKSFQSGSRGACSGRDPAVEARLGTSRAVDGFGARSLLLAPALLTGRPFASPANAERWLSEHPQVRGNVISMQDAAAAERAVFGDVLTKS